VSQNAPSASRQPAASPIGFPGRFLVRAFACLAVMLLGVCWPAAASAQSIIWTIDDCPHTPGTAAALVEGGTRAHPTLLGNVSITCDDMRLNADEVTGVRDSATNALHITAKGNVVFIEGGTRISAERLEFDVKTKTGTFYVASGQLALLVGKSTSTAAAKRLDSSLFGGQEPDAYFRGDLIEKLGPNQYRITHGIFTTCVQPTPRWVLTGTTATITLHEHAVIHNAVLRVKGVPVFYSPIMYYPVKGSDRTSGFLLPNYGTSSIRGFTLNNAFFWALNRSQDVTFYHSWYAKLGQGLGTEYHFITDPTSQGDVKSNLVLQKEQVSADGTQITAPSDREFDIVGSLSQALSQNVRLQANVNYASSLVTQQLLQQNISSFTQRTRTIAANVYGTWGRYRVSGQTQILDTFYGTTDADRYGHLPSVAFSMAQATIGHIPIYFGMNANYDDIVHYPLLGSSTNIGLRRLDLKPAVRAPIGKLTFLQVNTSASWEFTDWSQSLDATGAQVKVPISRRVFDLRAQVVGPILTRVFDTPGSGYAEKFKHVFAPVFTVDRVSAIDNFANIVQLDNTDNIVGGVTSLTYGLSNTLSAKRRTASGDSVSSQILDVEINQTYYSDPTASIADAQYPSNFRTGVPGSFSPIAITTTAAPTSLLNSNVRIEYSWQHSAIQAISAGGGVRTSTAVINASWTRSFLPTSFGTGTATTPPPVPTEVTHALNVSTTIKAPDNHIGVNWSWNYDFLNHYMLQQQFSFYLSSQCCGVAANLQTVSIPASGSFAATNDRRFTISFTLAGIGSFANPLGAFGQGR
jgi:LPS-assembly protein